jgi:predicted RNA binding protein YcfA (HicA-like mRNA interferase family)
LPRLRPIHGKDPIRILCNNFGFSAAKQKGSNVTLQRDDTFVTVPLKEIQVGLLNRILKDCRISRDNFLHVI